jgi:hypothetical protein|nr:MAG TPA: tail completion protein [Caudoviricetes sp.]
MLTGIELVQQVCRGLVDVPVVSKVPMKRPELFVRVDSGAPRRINPLQDQVRIIVQVYGVDLEQVIETAHDLHEALLDISVLHSYAFGWDVDTGPYEFPDPDIPDHRWQFSGTLYMQAF